MQWPGHFEKSMSFLGNNYFLDTYKDLPVIIIAIAFVLLIPISIFAQDSQNIFDEASQQATIESIERFGIDGTIIQTSEFDGIYEAIVMIKDNENEVVITYFEIEDGYVKAHNLGVEGQLYSIDSIIGAELFETIFDCYDCVDGPKISPFDCFGQLQFVSDQHNFGKLQCGEDSFPFEAIWIATLDEQIESETQNQGGGCLIATATFGSELAPQVQMLRELRDNQLLNTESGTTFINSFNDFYYSFSPYIADYERENPIFKEMVKIAITPMITSLSILNYVDMDSEVEVLGYGISLILLNVGMYVGIPAIAIMRIRK